MNHLLTDDWFFLLTAHQMISHHCSHASCCACVCVLTRYTPVMSTRSSEDLFFPYMDVHHNEGRSQAHAALISVIKMFYFTFYRKEEIKQNLKQSVFHRQAFGRLTASW